MFLLFKFIRVTDFLNLRNDTIDHTIHYIYKTNIDRESYIRRLEFSPQTSNDNLMPTHRT